MIGRVTASAANCGRKSGSRGGGNHAGGDGEIHRVGCRQIGKHVKAHHAWAVIRHADVPLRNVVTAELCAIEKQLVVFTRVTVGIERGERGGGGVGGIDPAEHHRALIDFGRRGYAVNIAAALGERVIEIVRQRGRLIHRHERDMLHASVEIIRRRF